MGFLDNSTITVDAILTKRGREILSQGGNFNITKFALSDEEVDYTLYDVTHPNGTDSYGAVIENMSLLEGAPNRTTFNSFLTNLSMNELRSAIFKDWPVSKIKYAVEPFRMLSGVGKIELVKSSASLVFGIPVIIDCM